MGWLENDESDFKYECEDKHLTVVRASTKSEYREPTPCIECSKPAGYIGFINPTISVITKVSYEQNGRLAYRISDGKGSVTHMSQTKYSYMASGKIVEKHAKGYSK